MGTGQTSLQMVPVGDPGNAPDTRYGGSFGSVSYTYNIGKYEVTAGQYVQFLNAVAKTDTYGLYNAWMDLSGYQYGCNIKRSGSSGNYTYSVPMDKANWPINHVSWGSSARFCNWLANGQPTGSQNLTTTEDGSYYLNGAITDTQLLEVTRKRSAIWVIPTEDEWYKAAYYKSGGINAGYWDYPTCSNSVSKVQANYNSDGLTPVGSYPYAGPYGTFDQGGNVFEWNETALYGSNPTVRGMRGGSWGWYSTGLLASVGDSRVPTELNSGIGFRIAEVPEPASIVIFIISGIAVLCRQKVYRNYIFKHHGKVVDDEENPLVTIYSIFCLCLYKWGRFCRSFIYRNWNWRDNRSA